MQNEYAINLINELHSTEDEGIKETLTEQLQAIIKRNNRENYKNIIT